jgi:hypothetical protein
MHPVGVNAASLLQMGKDHKLWVICSLNFDILHPSLITEIG